MSNLDLYKTMHKTGAFAGLSVMRYENEIRDLITKTNAKKIVDVGCGKAMAYLLEDFHVRLGIPLPFLYDPAVPQFNNQPSVLFDGAICSDVLEHLEEPEITETFNNLVRWTVKDNGFVFLSICCRPAKKTLPDGRNTHLTIQPPAWWREKIEAVFGGDVKGDNFHVLHAFEE